jgi:hypothetical protein
MIQDNNKSATNREAEKALVRKAYDSSNPKREEDRNRLMEYIYGTYEKELRKCAGKFLFRNKYLDTPDDVLMRFIKEKLLECDALAKFRSECSLKSHLYKLLRSYIIDNYGRKTPRSKNTPHFLQSADMEMAEKYEYKDIVKESISQILPLALGELSKVNPLDAKWFIEYYSAKILRVDMKNNPDDNVIKEAAVAEEEISYSSPEASKACKKERKQLTDRLLRVKNNGAVVVRKNTEYKRPCYERCLSGNR